MDKEAADTFRTKGHFPLQKTKEVLLSCKETFG